MSFKFDNQYFIKNVLWLEMKNLSLEEKTRRYNSSVKTEARKRLAISYENWVKDIDSKKLFYQEALDVLGLYDGEFLALSIYFEQETDQLLDSLGDQMRNLFSRQAFKFKTIFDLIDSSSTPQYSTEAFLKRFFLDTIIMTETDWELENENVNPLITKFSTFLSVAIVEKEPDLVEIQEAILHFAKLWQTLYSFPFNFKKALLLIFKLKELYLRIERTEIGIDILDVLDKCYCIIDELLPEVSRCPFADLSHMGIRNLSTLAQNHFAYRSKLDDLYEVLSEDRIFFTDLSGVTLPELFRQFIESGNRKRKAYTREFERRNHSNLIPSDDELEWFSSSALKMTNIEDLAAKSLYHSILRRNYIFYAFH